DYIVELPVLHRHRDRRIDRIDVGRLPRTLAAEKNVLKFHLRDNLAAVKDQVVERLGADAGCDHLWLLPTAFGQRTVTIIKAFSRRTWAGLYPHWLWRVRSVWP